MNILASFTPVQGATYLKTLPSIRERCTRVHECAKQGLLQHFDYDPSKEAEVVKYCVDIIKRDFGPNFQSIPPHGRWRHFDVNRPRVDALVAEWSGNNPKLEVCKRLIDLFVVSVLLDAGAGNDWRYREKETGEVYSRSEGLAIASLDMFKAGLFSADSNNPFRVDGEGLSRLTTETISSAMQVSASNSMVGLDGRANLLAKLANALESNSTFFGLDARPGNLLDFLKSESLPSDSSEYDRRIHVSVLWIVLIDGLTPIWPKSRCQLGGIALGDVWPCSPLETSSPGAITREGDNLVPFHKLSQWLAYSLIEPIEKILKWKIEGLEDLTGLPEYRNGGLLVDFGVLSLRTSTIAQNFYPDTSSIPKLPPSHPAIIEWRAMTVIELDRLAEMIRKQLNAPNLSLAQVLESATWKGGREIARQKRPKTGGPPIEIDSDGTVF